MQSVCLGFQKLTGLDSAKSLTIPSGTQYARIQAESQAVRWRADGTAPDGSVGEIIPVNGVITLTMEEGLATAQFFEDAATGTLTVHYFGQQES